jgi:hypothetical protein
MYYIEKFKVVNIIIRKILDKQKILLESKIGNHYITIK